MLKVFYTYKKKKTVKSRIASVWFCGDPHNKKNVDSRFLKLEIDFKYRCISATTQ